MRHDYPEAFRWKDWDWRPLARLVGWFAIAAGLAHARFVAPISLLCQGLTAAILLSVLSFGILTHLLLIIAMGVLRLAMALDEAAYGICERLVTPLLGPMSLPSTFLASFGAEIGLAVGAGAILRTAHAGAWLVAGFSGVLR